MFASLPQTLDKSLEKLRVKDKGTTRLNDANSEYQKQHQKNEKTRTPSGPTKINVSGGNISEGLKNLKSIKLFF